MNILILGGTIFLGRVLVEASIKRGHHLTLFNRGKSAPNLYPNIEQLHRRKQMFIEGVSRVLVARVKQIPHFLQHITVLAGMDATFGASLVFFQKLFSHQYFLLMNLPFFWQRTGQSCDCLTDIFRT